MSENKVLAKVGGRPITEEYVNFILQSMGPQRAMQFNSEEGRKTLLNDLINEELFYMGAKDDGMEDDPQFKLELEKMKTNLLKQYALKVLLQDIKVEDEEVESYYNENKEQFKSPESVKASHILVDDENKANEIIEELNNGLSFEEAAGKYSKCPSKARGGDLGFFTRGKMVPEFEKAAFEMKKDEISKPVKTQFGYHIIKLTDRKEPGISSLEEVKDKLKETILVNKQRKVYMDKVNQLKAKYQVEIFE